MLSIILAFLTSCAFSMPYEILDTAEIGLHMPTGTLVEKASAFLPVLGERMFPQSIVYFILFLMVYKFMLRRISGKPFSPAALAAGGLFSFYLLAGECAVLTGDLGSLFCSGPQCVITLLKAFGYLLLFYTAVRYGFIVLDERGNKQIPGGLSAAVYDRHSYALPLLIILVCWLPYLTAFFPGFVPSDGLKQLNNFFGSGHFTNNHPAFSTMLMGWAMTLGRKLGSDNLGLFLFTGPQALINAAVMAACFPLFKELRTPLWLRRLALADFALLPVWPNYAYSLLKDSLYMAMILLFVILMVRIIRSAEKFCGSPGKLILMTACLTLMMLVRHEGQYVAAVIFLSLFTISSVRGQWKRLLPVLLVPLAIVNIFNRVILPELGIDDPPAREALTMPMRQTAAVVMNDEESLTEEQSEVLHELFEYDRIPEMYSVDNADFLKGLFDPWAPQENIRRFMKVWAELGLKHPLTYLNVFLCSNSHYYDPFLGPYRDIYGWFGIEQQSYVNKGLFEIGYADRTAALRSALINLADGLPRLPLTSLFYSLGANAWVMLFCLFYLLRRSIRGNIIPLLPGLITFLLLQNSAINGFFRYMLPLLITLPVITAWTLPQKNGED